MNEKIKILNVNKNINMQFTLSILKIQVAKFSMEKVLINVVNRKVTIFGKNVCNQE